ncbi:hypothetical protein [Streptomyces capoamus]|uniref:hypothetical protein n=1 Tax=Streptomyces capoamus TaxID=68183 RepID=UPI00339B5AC3
MASYVITARNSSVETVVSVQISAINQEGSAVPELNVVNAVRQYLASVPGVASVQAQKFEQVITVV